MSGVFSVFCVHVVCAYLHVLCGGGGSDVRLDPCVSPYESVLAPDSGGRTPGSQTPGVPATRSPRQPTVVWRSRNQAGRIDSRIGVHFHVETY